MAEETKEKPASVADALAQAEKSERLPDWDAQMSDSGEIEFVKKAETVPVHSEKKFTNNEQKADSEQKETEQPKETEDPNPWEKRFKDTQSAYTKEHDARIKAEAKLESLEKRLERLESTTSESSPDSSQELDLEEAMADPDLFKKYLNSAIKKAVGEKEASQPELPPQVQEALEDYQIRKELQDLMVGEGQEAVQQRLPVMKSLLEVYPDATFRQLFDAAVKMDTFTSIKEGEPGETGDEKEKSTQSAQGEADSERKDQTDGTADQLRERAAKLQTEKSTPGSLKQQGNRPSTVAAAVDQAIEVLDI
jgi:hypothetical protein